MAFEWLLRIMKNLPLSFSKASNSLLLSEFSNLSSSLSEAKRGEGSIYKIFSILILSFSFQSLALEYDEYKLFHYSNMCSNYFDHFEQKHNIPTHLLRSISVVESGRWHEKSGIYLPWPWAVNQGGKAYYFATKDDAIEGVKKMLTQGITNIDVGCMQINLHHHPSAFANLSQAFEPKDNIAYAANFLLNHYNQTSSWQKAVASYHSLTSIGYAYANKVFKFHNNYANNTLSINYCTSPTGEIISCKTATKNGGSANFYLTSHKEILPPNKTNIKLSSGYSRKSPKRLKSAMVSYSVKDN